MKKFLLLLVTVGALFGLAACTNAQASEGDYFVGIDINPSIEFIVDEDDIVLSYELLNEDAEIIAADLDFVGMNVEDAMALFIERATEAGYIDVTSEENAILITVIGEENDEHVEELEENLRNRAQNDFARRNIMASVFTEDFSAEDLVAEADELGISPGKLKMIKAAQLVDETLTTEEAIEMSVRDIMSIIRAHHQEVRQQMRTSRMEERMATRLQLIEEHRAELEQHLRENEDLTEEEIAAILERIEERTSRMTERFEDRKQAWEDRMNDRNLPPYNDDEEDPSDSEENPS